MALKEKSRKEGSRNTTKRANSIK